MTCSNCGHESNGKFCGKCGTPTTLPQSEPGVLRLQEKCLSCGGWITPGKKFCGGCGAPLGVNEVDSPATEKKISPLLAAAVGFAAGVGATALVNAAKTDVEKLDKYIIRLHLLESVIMRCVSEKEMQAYSNHKSVIVSPGTILMVIADGRIAAKLPSGKYDLRKENSGNFLEKIINWFRRKDNVTEEQAISHQEAETIRKAKHISLVLVREGDFDLEFVFEGEEKLPFAGGVTSEVGITLLLKVNDAEALFKQAMVDKVIKANLADLLKPRLRMELSRILPSYQMENFVPGPELLDGLPPILRAAMDTAYPGITMLRVITATTKGEQLNSIREAANEMYTAKLKLAQNEELFAIRNIARSQENRKLIDDAKNDAEMSEALRAIGDEAKRSGMVSEETMDVFRMEMLERYKDRAIDSVTKDMKRSQVIDLMDIDLTLEREKADIRSRIMLGQDGHVLSLQELDQQLELRKRHQEGLVGIERVGDSYDDERRDKDLEFDAKKRTQDIQLQSESRGEKLKRLAELDAIRKQREDAKHEREIEAKRTDAENERLKLQAQAGLTAEQLMASVLDAENAGEALKAKFSGEHLSDIQKARENDMDAERKRMEAMMNRMQQMAEGAMKQTANIASGQNAAHQKELDRAAKSADERGDEIVKSVGDVLKASSTVFAADARAKAPQQKIGWYCKCGAGNPREASFCLECGENKDKTTASDQRPSGQEDSQSPE